MSAAGNVRRLTQLIDGTDRDSDILAELSSLSPSDISKYQTRIAYPVDIKDKFPERSEDSARPDDDDSMLWMYSSLIHLRVFLNAAHNSLYRASGASFCAGARDLANNV